METNCSSQSSVALHHKSTIRQVTAVFVIITSTIGNSLVMLAIYRFRSLRTTSNFIILNLSATDLLFSLAFVPVQMYFWSTDISTISSGLCTAAGMGGELCCFVSIYTLVFVSVERFLATNYPMRHKAVFTKKAVKIGLSIIWILSTTLTSVSFITQRYVYNEKFYHCMIDYENSKEMALAMVVVGFSFPLLTLFFCNVLITKAVWKSRRFMSEHASTSRHNGAGFFQEHRTSLLTIAVIMAFILLWMPYTIAGFSLAFKIFRFPEEFMSVALLLAGTNAAVNPVIYGVMNKNFRTAFTKIVCRKK